MNSRRILRRSLWWSLLMKLFILLIVWLIAQLMNPGATEPATNDPTDTYTPPSGIVTDEFEQQIEKQASKNLGRDVQATCPERIELIQGNQMTCLISEATDQVSDVGTPLADALVTITGDPGDAGKVKWKWEAVEPSVSGITPEPL
ncbi:MAG: hypothetical protein QM597_05130 [Aeromicrobium sp.]|uniref:hypothetical protein n=1 Tax=Aeromicrobium sp. TaxID=1871063 RepID=UPI0039E370AD